MNRKYLKHWMFSIFAGYLPHSAYAFWVDGNGHYALRGTTQTSPGFSKKTGTFQAVEQSFRLLGEARLNDNSSMIVEFRLFDKPREAYWGDTPQPEDQIACDRNVDRDENSDPNRLRTSELPCKQQNSGEPGYAPYIPKIYQAYVRYGFEYCLIEAGRRPRDWGLGIFLDSGKDPFDMSQSIFDGVTCNINIQKSQTLGFSVGYDKLAERGAHIYVDNEQYFERRFGANDLGDDLDQFFFTIEYDDRKANAGAAFTKNIGVYFAQVTSKALKDGGTNTDLKFLDLYTGFFLSDLSLRNEVIFRMGKSADPSWQLLGGAALRDGEPATNNLQAIGIAGDLSYTIAQSGSALGPQEFNMGDASRHLLFFSYAYAPGDADGYFDPQTTNPDAIGSGELSDAKRDGAAKAMVLNRNYRPALILLNGRPELDSGRVDGVWNPSRVMNASIFTTGYRYESQKTGNFEFKLVTANMIQTASEEVKNYVLAMNKTETSAGKESTARPMGYYGKNLGYELDLTYTYKIANEAELGIATAAALPGDAWRTDEIVKPTNDFLVQTSATFKF